MATVTLSTIPNELHLEILRRMDVPSICTMKCVNHHFKQLIDANEDIIVRGVLTNVECVGPHSILLRFYPLTENPCSCTLEHAQWIHRNKQTILRVAQICNITTNAKIDALYCIQHICKNAWKFYTGDTIDFNLGLHNGDITMVLDLIRQTLLSPYTTEQLQNMLPICIRLVFKLAYQRGKHFQGSFLNMEDYSRYNSYLMENGPEIIAYLEDNPYEKTNGTMLFAGLQQDEDVDFPWMHDELIKFLKTRGTGLMTDPGIEIAQFFNEEDTFLNMREN